jgi:hypothetical protein
LCALLSAKPHLTLIYFCTQHIYLDEHYLYQLFYQYVPFRAEPISASERAVYELNVGIIRAKEGAEKEKDKSCQYGQCDEQEKEKYFGKYADKENTKEQRRNKQLEVGSSKVSCIPRQDPPSKVKGRWPSLRHVRI